MIKLLKYLKGKAIICAIIAPLMMVLEVSMDLLQPTLLSKIIDFGVVNNDIQYVYSTGIKMMFAAFLGILGGSGCSVFATIASVRFGQNLRQGLFDKIQSLSFQEIDTLKTSSLITRLTNDVSQMQNMVITVLRAMIRSPFLCIGGIIMAYSLDYKLANLLLISLILIITAIIIVIKLSFPHFLLLQEKIDSMNNVMRENILGVKVIKIFNIVSKQITKFNQTNDELKSQNIKAQNINMTLWPIVTLIMNFTIIAILWIGGIMVNHNVLQVGVIMAFINYIIQIMNAIINMANALISLSRAKASADRINEVLQITTSMKSNNIITYLPNYDIKFRKVSFKYNLSGEYALKNIDLHIRQGEKIGIIGSTGSGKSTLVNLITRLYDVTEGEILIGGINIKDINISQLRDSISLVTQDNTIFSGTIEENIRFGNKNVDDASIINSAKTAKAYDFIMNKKHGFQTNTEQRGLNLSGGQKQRICIARALVKNSNILILDDSTSALDMLTEAQLQKELKSKLANKTLITIAQRISAISDSDKIIVVDEGQISAIGNHEYLLKNNEIYKKIAISQFGEDVIKIG